LRLTLAPARDVLPPELDAAHQNKRSRPIGTRASSGPRGTTQLVRLCQILSTTNGQHPAPCGAAIGCPDNGGLPGADYSSWVPGVGVPDLLPAISPVGSGANFGGLPPGGASSLAPGTHARDRGPTSLAASFRLLFSVKACVACILVVDYTTCHPDVQVEFLTDPRRKSVEWASW